MHKLFYKSLIILLILLSQTVYAQNSDDEFGKNRIQYERFEWRFLSSENFDVYFYQGGEKIAKEVTEYLEEEFDRITDLIGYPPYSKTKLFLYNSSSDLKQSNLGIDEQGITIGGETQFIKSYIEVAHPGSISELKEELLTKVSSMMVNEMMFGGNLKDMFQSSVLLNLPEWFISGAALYVSEGWSIEMDDFTRDYIKTKKPEKLSRLTGKEAALAGQSVWNYISEQYGRSNLSSILNYTRIIRNEKRSIETSLGIPYEQLMINWQTYYLNIEDRVSKNYAMIEADKKVFKGKNRKNKIFNHVAFNPQGDKMAYTENNNGRYKVIVKDLNTGKETIAIKGGYQVINQEIDHNLPLIDWADSTTLGIIHTKHGKLWFELFDYNTKSTLPRVLNRLEQVKSMNFSDNGRLIIVSAIVNGQNDLFLLSTRRDRVKRLTTDIYDDIDASFVPNTNTIIFSSNRKTDTLNVKNKNFEVVSDNYNLFFYSLDTTKNVLERITNTISKDTHPIAYNSNEIYYLSDQKGIVNIFKYDRTTKIYSQTSNYASSITDFDISFNQNKLGVTQSMTGIDYVYLLDDFNFNQQIFTPITPRQQVLQARAFKTKKREQAVESRTIQDIIESRLKQKENAIDENSSLDTAQFVFEEPVLESDTVIVADSLALIPDNLGAIENDTLQLVTDDSLNNNEVTDTKPNTDNDEIINTDNYTFETDILESVQENSDSFLAQYSKLRQKAQISGPYPYEPRFSANNLVTSFKIDPLRGFGINIQAEMYDMLEDHKFKGGMMVTTDLRSGDIFAEYSFLRNRLDYSARFERNVILRETSTNLDKYSMNTFQLGVALPFNNKTRFAIKPFYANTHFDDLDPINGTTSPPNFNKQITEQYIGVVSELVYDNSKVNGMNLIEGSRGKIKFTHYEGVENKDLSFSNISVDLRHYQKIHKEIVLAARVFYGSYFGRNPKQYLLGGMDNWIFNEENTEGDNNPLNDKNENGNTDLLFVDYATNLRGFDYAQIVGRNTLLFNAELRVPIIKYLSSGPITSNFFRNLQFTGFFDIGSAWTGKSPFNQDNTISTETISEGGFVIDIKNFQNPWLYSYGAGIRTMLLGYYMKLDVAWPVEDYQTNDTRFILTLGYDF